ncbi:pinensin family lanthipeptide [Roseivirga sp. BDSF3-8]|uniref:pinensin family lanthipeptide n=1 Tax=Roseivirga sp. BDSF3-8 TaxID=3241598 RepID=UPI003531DDCB
MKKLSLKDLKVSSFITGSNVKGGTNQITMYGCESFKCGDSGFYSCGPSEAVSACVRNTMCVYQ